MKNKKWYGAVCLTDSHQNVFWGKIHDVSQCHSQRSHPSMNLGVKWDLCVLFVRTAVKCQPSGSHVAAEQG